MTTLKPGDRVDIRIDNAEVTRVADDLIDITYGGSPVTFDCPASIRIGEKRGVTVALRTPQPQAGEVWELRGGEVVHVFSGLPAGLFCLNPELGSSNKLNPADFTDARCVYPPERATPVADEPAAFQAGDVWRMGNKVPVFFQVYGKEGHLRGKNVNDSEDLAIDEIVWEGAELLFRLDQAEQPVAQPAMLRRIETVTSTGTYIWRETAPGSGQYDRQGRAEHGYPTVTRADLVRDCANFTDLTPVPASNGEA